MTPPVIKKKEDRRDLEKRLISQQTMGKGFLQNLQMGKSSNKD